MSLFSTKVSVQYVSLQIDWIGGLKISRHSRGLLQKGAQSLGLRNENQKCTLCISAQYKWAPDPMLTQWTSKIQFRTHCR